MQKYAVLNSGFISNNHSLLTLNPVHNQKFNELLLNKSHLNTASPFFYNKDIVELFHIWSCDNTIVKDMQFRERVIMLMIKLFQNKPLYNWMIDQSDVLNKTINQTHISFLLQSIEYMLYGKNREICITQWIRLLLVNNDVYNYDDAYIRKFAKDISVIQGMDLLTIIQTWLTKINGLEDMLIFMYVIFGDRNFITEIKNV